MLFSVSDLCISTTLLLNAMALLSSRISHVTAETIENEIEMGMKSGEEAAEDSGNTVGLFHCISNIIRDNVATKLKRLSHRIRMYSCILVIWNMFFFLLMILVFQ